MQLWLSHWHCIVPLAALMIGMLFMGRNPKEKSESRTRNHDIDDR